MRCPIGESRDAFVIFVENSLSTGEIAEVVEMLEELELQNEVAVELFP